MIRSSLIRVRKRLALALAAALLFAALAPAVVQWLAFTQGANSVWAELCTASGIKLVKLTGKSASDTDPLSGHKAKNHCPLCVLHAGLDVAVPNSAVERAAPAHELDLTPRLFFLSPKPLYAWASARSRAPPLTAS